MFKELRHPILIHKLNLIRSKDTPRQLVKSLVRDIGFLVTYEVLRDLSLHKRSIEIWIGDREFEFIREEDIVLIAILRAGVPMLEGAEKVVPNASSGFLAMSRDEETLRAEIYYSRLPPLDGKRVIILDPMLATGGTLELALREVWTYRPLETLSLHLVSAPEGVGRIRESFPEHRIYSVSLDERLNDKGFILPGLGDMGDRLFS